MLLTADEFGWFQGWRSSHKSRWLCSKWKSCMRWIHASPRRDIFDVVADVQFPCGKQSPHLEIKMQNVEKFKVSPCPKKLDPLSLRCCFVEHTHHGVCPIGEKKKGGRSCFTCFGYTCLCCPSLSLSLSLSLSPSLSLSVSFSLIHTQIHTFPWNTQTHVDTDAHTHAHTLLWEPTIPVCLRQYDSYSPVFTCSARRRGRWKGGAGSRNDTVHMFTISDPLPELEGHLRKTTHW